MAERKSHGLTETDVGIREYLCHSEPFAAIIKHRYADFHVHEVDLLGNTVHLTSLSVPMQPGVNIQPSESTFGKTDMEKCKDVATIIGNEDLKDIIYDFLNNESSTVDHIPVPAPSEKEKRSKIHQVVRANFHGRLGTSLDNEINVIKIERFKANLHRERNHKANFKELGGDYLHFTLYKEDRDTMETINYISKLSKIIKKNFDFAGTKDRRAITTQRVSVKRVKAETLSAVNKKLTNARVGNFSYSNQRLNLGDLKGNQFKIALRNVVGNLDRIEESLRSLKNVGFINYFGMQRFGTRSTPTSEVGIKILAEKWGEAVELLMEPQVQDSGKFLEAREHWKEHRDAQAALKLFPKRAEAEHAILQSYINQGERFNNNDQTCHRTAISAIPRKLKTLYLHAYQSLVWNEMVTWRIRLYGNNVVRGDIVLEHPHKTFELANPNDDADKIGVAISNRRETKPSVKIIETEADLISYNIYDVVLPTPGYEVIYPKNEVFEHYKEFMAKHGCDPNGMKREIRLQGSYRRILAKPIDCSWEFLTYGKNSDVKIDENGTDTLNREEDENNNINEENEGSRGVDVGEQDLIQSDLSKLESRPFSISHGSKLAIILSLTLNTSQYATMAIRELTKTDTSHSFQTSLSNCTGGGFADSVKSAHSIDFEERKVFFENKRRKIAQ